MIHDLFGEGELEPGQMRSVQVAGISILVVRRPDGSFRAMRDVCPHLGVQLSRGSAEHIVTGNDIGEYAFGGPFVARCSWHGYEFDVDNGRCVADSRWRVKTYPVTVDDGRVMLER
jgi:nitrite reductase/ring-hydroxylating ferredoxin subunit